MTNSLLDGLVSAVTFDEGTYSGNVADDLSGNGNHVTKASGSIFGEESDVRGQSMRINTNNTQQASIPAGIFSGEQTGFATYFWSRLNHNDNDRARLFGISNTGVSHFTSLLGVAILARELTTTYHTVVNGSRVDSGAVMPVGEWIPILINFKDGVIKFYINRELVRTTEVSSLNIAGEIRFTNMGGSGARWRAGASIDEFNLWNRGLSNSEVDYLLTDKLYSFDDFVSGGPPSNNFVRKNGIFVPVSTGIKSGSSFISTTTLIKKDGIWT